MNGGLPFSPSDMPSVRISHAIWDALTPAGGAMNNSISCIDCCHSYTVRPDEARGETMGRQHINHARATPTFVDKLVPPSRACRSCHEFKACARPAVLVSCCPQRSEGGRQRVFREGAHVLALPVACDERTVRAARTCRHIAFRKQAHGWLEAVPGVCAAFKKCSCFASHV